MKQNIRQAGKFLELWEKWGTAVETVSHQFC